jgi:hypothetical protein
MKYVQLVVEIIVWTVVFALVGVHSDKVDDFFAEIVRGRLW